MASRHEKEKENGRWRDGVEMACSDLGKMEPHDGGKGSHGEMHWHLIRLKLPTVVLSYMRYKTAVGVVEKSRRVNWRASLRCPG